MYLEQNIAKFRHYTNILEMKSNVLEESSPYKSLE